MVYARNHAGSPRCPILCGHEYDGTLELHSPTQAQEPKPGRCRLASVGARGVGCCVWRRTYCMSVVHIKGAVPRFYVKLRTSMVKSRDLCISIFSAKGRSPQSVKAFVATPWSWSSRAGADMIRATKRVSLPFFLVFSLGSLPSLAGVTGAGCGAPHRPMGRGIVLTNAATSGSAIYSSVRCLSVGIAWKSSRSISPSPGGFKRTYTACRTVDNMGRKYMKACLGLFEMSNPGHQQKRGPVTCLVRFLAVSCSLYDGVETANDVLAGSGGFGLRIHSACVQCYH